MTARTALRPPARRAWRLWALLLGIGIVLLAGWFWRRSERPVNLLLITLDTTRADRIGCYGYEAAGTPRLDDLAARGVLFRRAYTPAPMTAPSHTSLFTGLLPPEHGVYTNGIVALEPDVPVLAEQLQQRGYQTAAFVASVVLQARSGLNRGFDVYNDDLSSAKLEGDELHRSRDGAHVVAAATRWLTGRPRGAKPFFCWVHFFDPHDPYLPHEAEFGRQFVNRPYDGEIAYVDQQVGRLQDTLQKLQLQDDTVIVVVGDHGESLGEHEELNHGFLLHDSTLRVPLIIVDPRVGAAGREVADPVSLIDLYSTLLEFGQVKPPPETADRSLVGVVRGHPVTVRPCYSQTLEPLVEAGWSPLIGLTTARWRYVRTTQPELYDLSADPGELQNLATQEPDRVSELDGELAEIERTFRRRTGSKLTLSDREQRALESLGYTGGASVDSPAGDNPRPDIKDMIGDLNQMFRAMEHMEKQEFDAAGDLLEPLAENVPDLLRAKFTLGMCRVRQGRFEEALRWLDATLEMDPNYERARILAGFSHLKLRQLDQAETHLRRALELNPDSENGHLFFGEVAQRREQFPLAMRHYGEVLRINPGNRQAREAFAALQAAGIQP